MSLVIGELINEEKKKNRRKAALVKVRSPKDKCGAILVQGHGNIKDL